MSKMHMLNPTQAEIRDKELTIEAMTGFMPQITTAFEDDPVTNSTKSDLQAIGAENDRFQHMLADITESDVCATVATETSDEPLFGSEKYQQRVLSITGRLDRGVAISVTSENYAQHNGLVAIATRQPALLRKRYDASMEGFVSDMDYRLGKLKMGMDTINTRFSNAVTAYENKGPLDGVIKNPAYAKWLGLSSGHHSASDVLHAVTEFMSKHDLVKARNALDQITKSYKVVADAISNGKLMDNGKEAAAVQREIVNLRDIHKSIMGEYKPPADVSCVIEPLRPSDIKDIQAVFKKHFRENDIRDIDHSLKESLSVLTKIQRSEIFKRAAIVIGQRDLFRSVKHLFIAGQCSELAYAAFSSNQHALNALAYYVKDSTD